jgi:protein SCO1
MTPLRRLTSMLAVIVLAGALAGCGGTDAPEDAAPSSEDGLSGYRRTPAPSVADVAVPVLPDGDPASLAAEPGHLRVVYFGYTSCPDVCPTTMSDLRRALFDMDPADAARVDVMMVTIDPDRDVPEKLDAYVTTFIDDGTSVRMTDDAQLADVAEAFGARYEVTPVEGGEPEVSHSGDLYVVDEQGDIVLQWPFGITSEDLRKDLELLLTDPDPQSSPPSPDRSNP